MRTKMEETNNGERIRPGGSSRKSKPAILPLLSSAATRRLAGTPSRAERDLNVPAGEHRDSMGRETEGKEEGRGKALRWRGDSRFLFPFFLSLKTSFFSGHVVSAKLSAGKKEGEKKKQGEMPLAAWRNRGPLAPCLGSQRMQRSCADARALPSPSATRNLEQPRRMRTRGGIEAPNATTPAPPGTSCRPRPRPVAAVATCRAGGSSGGAGRLSSRGLPLPTLTASSPPEKSISNSRVAAKRGGGDGDEKEKQGGGGAGLLSRWAQLTAREKSVVAAFAALAVLFGPRLLLLSLVSLEAAATGALLAAERALGAAFLTSFTWLAAVAALILAGLLVYFLVLEEERLEDSDDE